MQCRDCTQQRLQYLAGEHAPKVAFDAIKRYCREDEEQPEQETDYAVEKGLCSLSEAV